MRISYGHLANVIDVVVHSILKCCRKIKMYFLFPFKFSWRYFFFCHFFFFFWTFLFLWSALVFGIKRHIVLFYLFDMKLKGHVELKMTARVKECWNKRGFNHISNEYQKTKITINHSKRIDRSVFLSVIA